MGGWLEEAGGEESAWEGGFGLLFGVGVGRWG